jgi:inorganic triphosphatase YgiF
MTASSTFKSRMRQEGSYQNQQEVELKLALLSTPLATLVKRLAQGQALRRHQPSSQLVHNIYYDTPAQNLRQQSVALRIRRIGGKAQHQWLQTLKTAGRSDSALSRRGEWEVPVASAKLSLSALKSTPWKTVDPDGQIFPALAPMFVTTFKRTSWLVPGVDGSLMEVSLDIGRIVAGPKSVPICELELELMAGQPAALFELAHQISRTMAVLPLNASKAARGYALINDSLSQPLSASPPKLSGDLSLTAAAVCVLREMWNQFSTNLNTLGHSDDPEVVHQARVGWRRFRSALRLFNPVLNVERMPSWEALQPLLITLSELRDIDVARLEILPTLADVYSAGDSQRMDAWQSMMNALLLAGKQHRRAVRKALQDPKVGSTLLLAAQWLEELASLTGPFNQKTKHGEHLQSWARRRIAHLHDELKGASKNSSSSAHRVRIQAKRLRYAVAALQNLLPKRRAERWYRQAASLQLSLGAARDLAQAGAVVARLNVDPGLAEFLRGFAIGKA